MSDDGEPGLWGRLTDWEKSPVVRLFKRMFYRECKPASVSRDFFAEEKSKIDEFEKLIDALKSPDPQVRGDAAEALGKTGEYPAIFALIDALKDVKMNVRRMATQALVSIGSLAVPALSEELAEGIECARECASEALGKIRDPQAIPALVEALKDEAVHVRGNAAWAIRKIANANPESMGILFAVPALVEALKDTDVNVRYSISRALGFILNNCKTSEQIEEFEKRLYEGCKNLSKTYTSTEEAQETFMELAKLRKSVADRKNSLAQKRDIVLDDIPRPPKKTEMYQQMRRIVGNG
jgi:HEAT repeat protein